MPECHKCGSPVRHERQVHECPRDLRFVATRAYNGDVRRKRAVEHRLDQWVAMALARIADGMPVSEAIEIAVDCAFVHGRCSHTKAEIEAVILGART